MRYDDVAIPLPGGWTSPFVKWQGALAEISSLDVAAGVTTRALADRQIDPARLDGIVLGWTILRPDIFYGAPTLAARVGAPGLSGPMISQACATSLACLHAAAGAVETGGGAQLVVTMDRTSNGPQLLYPAPSAQGGAPIVTHSQGPTGLRSITELIEELRLRGGGVGVFTGCATGDSGAALVVRVED